MEHLIKNNLIRESQHGFMPGKSCATNLIEFMEELTEEVDKGLAVDIIYLDFAKAFDKVPHKRLRIKLESKGIDPQACKWITAWLNDRKQQVKVNGALSDVSKVDSGVPQGTVLGPCLFNIHIDDLDEVVLPGVTIKKFADDTKAKKTIESPRDQEILQMSLNNMCIWAQKWGMDFNQKKCKVMHVGRNNPNLDYTLKGHTLEETEQERDIGIIIHKSLKPGAQCKRAAAKARAVLGQICRNFHFRDRHVFLQLYKQYVRPHLEFSSAAWSPWMQGDKDELEKVQEKVLRMTAGLKEREYKDRCKEVGLETLEERRTVNDLTETYKILTGVDKINPEKLFSLAAVRENNSTRMATGILNLQPRRARLDLRKYSFGNRVIPHWNTVPDEVKEAANKEIFKRRLRAYKRN